MADVYLLSILLIGWVQREKYAKGIEDLNSKLTKAQEVIKQRQDTVQVLA